MVKLVVSVLAAVLVSQSFAGRTNKLVNGASKWNETESYVLPFVPGQGDVVVVQATSTNYLHFADEKSVDVVTNLGAVVLKGFGNSSTLILDVPEGMTSHLHCPVSETASTRRHPGRMENW